MNIIIYIVFKGDVIPQPVSRCWPIDKLHRSSNPGCNCDSYEGDSTRHFQCTALVTNDSHGVSNTRKEKHIHPF